MTFTTQARQIYGSRFKLPTYVLRNVERVLQLRLPPILL